jgi:hypothetical protein
MKKLIVTGLLIIIVLSIANGQETKLGGGFALSSGFPFNLQTYTANRSGLTGLTLKYVHKITVPLDISASLTVFYPHITNDQLDKITISSMMFDINGHYRFMSSDRIEFYGLAGPDLLLALKKDAYAGSTTFRETDNALGLNLGAGTHFKITGKFYFYCEAKYILSKYHQFMLNAGVLIGLDRSKQQGKTEHN